MPIVGAPKDFKMDKVRIGIIGMGWMGETHSRAYRQIGDRFRDSGIRPRLVVCSDSLEQRANEARERFGFERSTTDWQEVIDNPAVEVVNIAAPNGRHLEMVEAAARAGKHIFCEKPLAMNFVEAKAMWAAARDRGIKTGMQFNPRYDPGWLKIKDLIKSGYIGDLRHLELNFATDAFANPSLPMMWRFDYSVSGTGALGDLGVYMIDIARWIAGDFQSVSGMLRTYVSERQVIPDEYDMFEVFAMGRKGNAPITGETALVDNDDEAIFLAKFENGATGQIKASRVNADPVTKFLGSEGVLMRNPHTMQLVAKRIGEKEFSEIDVPPTDSHLNIVRHMYDNIINDTDVGPNFYDGKQQQAVIDAVVRSDAERRWVEVSEFE